MTAVHFITKTSVFRQHKQVASNILLGVTNLLIFGSIILVNTQNRELLLKDTGSYLPPMEAFYYFGVTPLRPNLLLELALGPCCRASVFNRKMEGSTRVL